MNDVSTYTVSREIDIEELIEREDNRADLWETQLEALTEGTLS